MLFFEQTLNSTTGRSQRIYTAANGMSPLRSTWHIHVFRNVGQLLYYFPQERARRTQCKHLAIFKKTPRLPAKVDKKMQLSQAIATFGFYKSGTKKVVDYLWKGLTLFRDSQNVVSFYSQSKVFDHKSCIMWVKKWDNAPRMAESYVFMTIPGRSPALENWQRTFSVTHVFWKFFPNCTATSSAR